MLILNVIGLGQTLYAQGTEYETEQHGDEICWYLRVTVGKLIHLPRSNIGTCVVALESAIASKGKQPESNTIVHKP